LKIIGAVWCRGATISNAVAGSNSAASDIRPDNPPHTPSGDGSDALPNPAERGDLANIAATCLLAARTE
jgi:hypothetical protein